VANRLGNATSPYLLQHQDNPVDWWEWSPEAFEEARRRDVPVLLSVGYAACHWCHVMSSVTVAARGGRSGLSRTAMGAESSGFNRQRPRWAAESVSRTSVFPEKFFPAFPAH